MYARDSLLSTVFITFMVILHKLLVAWNIFGTTYSGREEGCHVVRGMLSHYSIRTKGNHTIQVTIVPSLGCYLMYFFFINQLRKDGSIGKLDVSFPQRPGCNPWLIDRQDSVILTILLTKQRQCQYRDVMNRVLMLVISCDWWLPGFESASIRPILPTSPRHYS